MVQAWLTATLSVGLFLLWNCNIIIRIGVQKNKLKLYLGTGILKEKLKFLGASRVFKNFTPRSVILQPNLDNVQTMTIF